MPAPKLNDSLVCTNHIDETSATANLHREQNGMQIVPLMYIHRRLAVPQRVSERALTHTHTHTHTHTDSQQVLKIKTFTHWVHSLTVSIRGYIVLPKSNTSTVPSYSTSTSPTDIDTRLINNPLTRLHWGWG